MICWRWNVKSWVSGKTRWSVIGTCPSEFSSQCKPSAASPLVLLLTARTSIASGGPRHLISAKPLPAFSAYQLTWSDGQALVVGGNPHATTIATTDGLLADLASDAAPSHAGGGLHSSTAVWWH